MLKKEAFDSIIKENLELYSPGGTSFGYKILGEDGIERCYDNYYTEDAFKEFKNEMKSAKYIQHYNRYAAGEGSELDKKRGRYGIMPPKMASVASSSRFCYLALRNGGKAIGADGDVMFEVGCKIDGVGRIPPQLDAWFPEKNIYVEAKCHEIFDSHKPVLKEVYWDFIYGQNNQFGFDVMEKNCEEEFTLSLAEFGIEKSSSMFDIKQFLCHLMGIASQKNSEKPATLFYLFFQPKTDNVDANKKICEVFNELKKEIHSIFYCKPIRTFTEKNNIKLMAVAEYDDVMQELTDENVIDLLE